MKEITSSKYIAAFYLILMCVAILPLEGWGVSKIKVAAMAAAPLIILIKVPVLTKAALWGTVYLLYVVFDLLLQGLPFRASTIIYLIMFVLMFVMYNNLIYTEAFTIDFYIKLIKYMLYAFIICIILQQLLVLAGIRYFPLLNLMGQPYLSVTRVNSLTWEPSSSARIMTVSFLAFMKTNEIKYGTPLTIRKLFGNYKWLTFGFLYAMVTMGSGTAFVGLAILSLYFLKKQYITFIIPVLLASYFIIPLINYEPLNRAMNAFEIILSDDPHRIAKDDTSAAVRMKPLINTFTNIDLTDKKTWFGEGTDASQKYSIRTKDFDKQMMSGINDYGLIGFILGVILIASCCLTRFLSIETLLLFILVGLTINNISYIWGIYMIWVPVKYFHQTYIHENPQSESGCHIDGGI